MFAFVATIFFVIAAVQDGHTDSPTFWALLGLAAWALHFAVDAYWALPIRGRRGAP